MTYSLAPTPETTIATNGIYETDDIIQLKGGNYVVTWENKVSTDAYDVVGLLFQVFSSDGNSIGASQPLNLSDGNLAHNFLDDVIAMNDGGFIVVWFHHDFSGPRSIVAQRFDADGNPVRFSPTDETTGAVTLIDNADGKPTVTVLADGGFVIQTVNALVTVEQRLYAPDGTFVDLVVENKTDGLTVDTNLVTLSDGTFISVSNFSQRKTWAVAVDHFDAGLARTSQTVLIDAGQKGRSPVSRVAAFDGGYMIVWLKGAGDGVVKGAPTPHGVFAQRFNNAGQALGDIFQVNTITSADDSGASVIVLADGTMVVAWTSALSKEFHTSAYYQRFDADGSPMGGEVRMGDEDRQDEVQIAALASGGFVATWHSWQSDGSSAMYSRQFIHGDPLGSNGNDNLTGNADNNVLPGYAGRDTLTGLGGNDLLDGGTGSDSLTGGTGNDTYIVDNAHDAVIEQVDEGTDTVKSTANLTLAANVENLILSGTGNICGTGNALDNTLTGNDGDNLLRAGDGNDTIDGGLGADNMLGNLGDDVFIVDNINDLVREFTGEGNDTVMSSVSYALGAAYVETLILTGAADIEAVGNALNNTLTGNIGNNRLDGGAGADTMSGGLGDDSYVVDTLTDVVIEMADEGQDTIYASVKFILADNVENMVQTGFSDLRGQGNALDNELIGNAGASLLYGMDGYDVIDGGAGMDKMYGGLGDDTFLVDNVADDVREYAGEGTDTVYASVSYSIATTAVENMILTGGALVATGNILANTLIGTAGANLIDGGGGADTMIGIGGDDTYMVDVGADIVIEQAGEGIDTVMALNSYTLSDNVENLVMISTGNIAGAGNDLDNVITGNTGNNRISGGGGADRFVFELSSGLDRVLDFSAAQGDTLDISAYTLGVDHGGGVTLTTSGANTLIDLGDGNVITVVGIKADNPGLISHIVW